jgi:hypothetical protein
VAAFCGIASCSVAFGDISQHTYFRWMFSPLALPIRILLIMGLIFFLLVSLNLALMAFLRKPIIDVHDGVVTMYFPKFRRFPISDVEEIGTLSNGDYFIRVKGRKYGVSPMLCQNGKTLRLNMEALRRHVSASS